MTVIAVPAHIYRFGDVARVITLLGSFTVHLSSNFAMRHNLINTQISFMSSFAYPYMVPRGRVEAELWVGSTTVMDFAGLGSITWKLRTAVLRTVF